MLTLLLVGTAISYLALVATVPPCTAASADPPVSTGTPPSGSLKPQDNPDFLIFKSVYLDPPKQVNRLIELPLELEDRRTLKTLANGSLFRGLLKGEGEVMYSPPAPGTFEQRGGSDRRLLRFGLTGNQGAFRYGVAMREAGKAAVAGPDQASREMWGEWQVGFARLRTTLSDVWNNVDKVQNLSRMTQTNERIALTLARPKWPELTIAYTRTALASSLDPQGVAPQQRALATYDSALAYAGTGWNASASAGYAVNSDLSAAGLDTRAFTYGLNGTYRVERLLTITPSLNVRDERQLWSGARIFSRSSSMTLAYTPDPTLTITALAAYNDSSSTDRLVSLSNFNSTNTVTWKPETLSRLHASLSLEASHKVSHNQLAAPQSLEDTSGLVRVQFADLVIW